MKKKHIKKVFLITGGSEETRYQKYLEIITQTPLFHSCFNKENERVVLLCFKYSALKGMTFDKAKKMAGQAVIDPTDEINFNKTPSFGVIDVSCLERPDRVFFPDPLPADLYQRHLYGTTSGETTAAIHVKLGIPCPESPEKTVLPEIKKAEESLFNKKRNYSGTVFSGKKRRTPADLPLLQSVCAPSNNAKHRG